MGIYSDIVFPNLEPLITKSLWKERRRLLKDVRGDVLEIGPGTGPFMDGHLIYSILFEFQLQGPAADAQYLCRMGSIPVGLRQGS